MIHLSMLIMAMFIKSNSGFYICEEIFFVILPKSTNSLLKDNKFELLSG